MSRNDESWSRFFAGLDFSTVSKESDLNYTDPYATAEQKKRDSQVTELLTAYVTSYKKKVRHSTICRYVILIPCIAIVMVFAGVLVYFSFQIMGEESTVEIPDLAAFITACVSFISLIIGLLTVVTKYFFPENDEQYITKIVDSIQKNDLENKRVNAGSQDQDCSSSP